MAGRHFARLGGWVAAALGLPTVTAVAGPLGIAIGLGVVVVAFLWAWMWLPRSAHAAFEGGRYARASRRYWMLGAVTWSAQRERAATLSRAGCRVADGRFPAADKLLARVAEGELDAAERAVYLNNRAYASLRSGGDAHTALALAEEATRLRPDVPAIQHTRGLALLAVGRTDDAIAVLDGMRTGGELPARLEAARCAELAAAWDAKGQTDYADDYRVRARMHGG